MVGIRDDFFRLVSLKDKASTAFGWTTCDKPSNEVNNINASTKCDFMTDSFENDQSGSAGREGEFG
jgi:hypothetical protein